jgi:hypothetical protein
VGRKATILMLDDGSDFNYTASSSEDQKQNSADVAHIDCTECTTLVRSLGGTSIQSLTAMLLVRFLIGCAENMSCILCCLVS